MQMDDMILIRNDDHMIEPLDMYENHVPAKCVLSGRCLRVRYFFTDPIEGL